MTDCMRFQQMIWSDWIGERWEWGGVFLSLLWLDVRWCLSLGYKYFSRCWMCRSNAAFDLLTSELLTFWPRCGVKRPVFLRQPHFRSEATSSVDACSGLTQTSFSSSMHVTHLHTFFFFFTLFGNDPDVLFPIKFASQFYLCSVFHKTHCYRNL